MFSLNQKQQIADAIEKLILSFNHPEMPEKNPSFVLKIDGKEVWSFAEIRPNWTFNEANKPAVNPWNEMMESNMREHPKS